MPQKPPQLLKTSGTTQSNGSTTAHTGSNTTNATKTGTTANVIQQPAPVDAVQPTAGQAERKVSYPQTTQQKQPFTIQNTMKQTRALPAYDGTLPKLGHIQYIGVPAEPIEFTISNGNSSSGGPDAWKLFDVFGYSGKANASGVTVTMSSSQSTAESPITSFYDWISTKYYLLVNAIRIQADNYNQLSQQFWIQYYGLNAQPIGQPFPVNVSAATTQDSANPNPVSYFGIEFAIANNIVMYGNINRNGGAGQIIMRIFVVDVDGVSMYN
jgi:hypothetical protein